MKKPTPEPHSPNPDDAHQWTIAMIVIGALLAGLIGWWMHGAYQRKHPAFVEVYNKVSEAVAGEGR